MRKVFLLVLLLVFGFQAHAQKAPDEIKLMIDSVVYIKYLRTTKALTTNQVETYFRALYLINEQDQPLNYLPNHTNLFKFINIYDVHSRKIIQKGIHAWKVFVSLNDNYLKIGIVDFGITYKKNDYKFSNSGGSETVFEFSCTENKWKLISSIDFGL